MKKLVLLSSAIVALLSLSLHAEDTKLTGEAVCAKCSLKVASACQLALKTTVGGKEEIILADNNAVAKGFHSEICKTSAKVNVEGVVTEKDGKKTIVLSKVEAAK